MKGALSTLKDAQILNTSAKRRWVRLAFLVVGVGVIALIPAFASGFMQGLLIRAFLFALLALSVDLLWGYTGILTLGQAAFFGIGAYAVGIAFTGFKGAYAVGSFDPSWDDAVLAVVLALVIAAVIGGAVGWFTFTDRASPLYIGVVTLALSVIFTQLMNSGGMFTGSSTGLTGFQTLDLGPNQWFWISAATLLIVFLGAYVLVNSDAGRLLIAIRENEERCRYLGFNTSRVKIVLLAVCGCIAALAGVLYALYTTVVAPSVGGFVLSTEAVIWTALGGRGTLIGPIAGAISISLLEPLLGGQFPFIWLLFIGVLFVVVVTLAPQGLFPLVANGIRHMWRRSPARAGRADERNEASGGALPAVDAPTRTAPAPSSQPLRSATAAEGRIALEAIEVKKQIGALEVLKGVTFAVRQGELLSIVGPNGAGKTTLIRCIADGRERSAGTVKVNGQPIRRHIPHRLVASGVGRKFQTANVFETLTVRESLQLATNKGHVPSIWRRTRHLNLPASVVAALEATGLNRMLDVQVRDLGHGSKQALELAMVLSLEPNVLLLDEPTAGLSHEERSSIGELLIELSNRGDMCVILIEHDFEFVKTISSRMLVLHQGTVLLDGTVDEVASSELVRSVYLGGGSY